jgi:hypothetical protein
MGGWMTAADPISVRYTELGKLNFMMLTLEISPEVQRELAREAQVRGVAVPVLAASLLEEAMAKTPATTTAQRSTLQIRAWLESIAEFSDQIPALPGETFSRSTLYQDHD